MVLRSASRIKGFGRLLLFARELPAGSVGTVQPARTPRFSTVPSAGILPLEDELLEDELEDELLEDELLLEELLEVELVLEELLELVLDEELLDDEVLLLPEPPQAVMADVSKAIEKHCSVRLVWADIGFCTCVLLADYFFR
jgi:hypothetical protein